MWSFRSTLFVYLLSNAAMNTSVLHTLCSPDSSRLSQIMEGLAKKTVTASKLFVSSPYNGSEHHLDLMSVPETSRQLARALQNLRPITDDYPSQPYDVSFNWQEIVDRLPSEFSGEFYCIAFYSSLHPNVDTVTLHHLDSLAHAEANQSGGLLKYWWQSPPNPTTRKNLATCVWTSWDHAKRAGRLPMHAKAMGATKESYEKWDVERYYLKISCGNHWKLEKIVL